MKKREYLPFLPGSVMHAFPEPGEDLQFKGEFCLILEAKLSGDWVTPTNARRLQLGLVRIFSNTN